MSYGVGFLGWPGETPRDGLRGAKMGAVFSLEVSSNSNMNHFVYKWLAVGIKF